MNEEYQGPMLNTLVEMIEAAVSERPVIQARSTLLIPPNIPNEKAPNVTAPYVPLPTNMQSSVINYVTTFLILSHKLFHVISILVNTCIVR